jgi:thiol-disulfide isomerase/thioredoxin
MTSVLGAGKNGFAVWTAATILALTGSQFALAQQPPKNFATHDAARPVAAVEFEDAPGHSRSLADFKGRVVLLNIWATWCVPCRKEMPALDRLQESSGGPDFEVVPLSIDRGGLEVVRKFYEEVGIRHLAMYVDVSGQAYRRLSVVGLPTTFLIDRSGLEVGLIIGPAEWDSPEIAEFLKPIISNRDAPAKRADQDDQGGPSPDGPGAPGRLARGLQWLRTFLNR